ncbi:MAG: hypothetical protein FWG63_05600 [Defluviitaleaceae bacterium]|nr:hypothetical protein [Defluviitaleaceae bacterium]
MNLSRVIGVLIALILLFGGVGAFLIIRTNTSVADTAIQQSRSEELLHAVMVIDRIGPIHSPYDLMYHVTDVLTALYSEELGNDALFTEIVRLHRLLFSQNALELNPFDVQHQNFTAQLTHHRAAGVFQTNIEIVGVFSGVPGYAYAHLSQTFENLGVVNWVYFLVYEDGWKIETLFPANDDFVPFVDDVNLTEQ